MGTPLCLVYIHQQSHSEFCRGVRVPCWCRPDLVQYPTKDKEADYIDRSEHAIAIYTEPKYITVDGDDNMTIQWKGWSLGTTKTTRGD